MAWKGSVLYLINLSFFLLFIGVFQKGRMARLGAEMRRNQDVCVVSNCVVGDAREVIASSV